MCNCNKSIDKVLPAEALKEIAENSKTIEKLGDESLQKISEGKPLTNQDICPFCKQHKRYWCRSGCILTGQRL